MHTGRLHPPCESAERAGQTPGLVIPGEKDCTPVNTSEGIVDFQWHFPMDVQWHFPKDVRMSVVLSKECSRVQWISTGICQ